MNRVSATKKTLAEITHLARFSLSLRYMEEVMLSILLLLFFTLTSSTKKKFDFKQKASTRRTRLAGSSKHKLFNGFVSYQSSYTLASRLLDR